MHISILEESAPAGYCYGRTAIYYQLINKINLSDQWTD